MSTRDHVIRVLRGGEASRIRFTIPAGGGLTINAARFRAVARAIENNHIQVKVVTTFPAGVGALYHPDTNTIETPPLLGRVSDGLLLHECTHAAFDIGHVGIVAVADEAAAYVVDALYFRMTGLQWESLMIPINLAFFYRDSASARVLAMYPSPAGATESLLSLESWEEIVAQNKALQSMEFDVEAFLVNRIGSAAEYFIVPIDECYRLVGLIRMHWRGLSGGTEVWQEIHQFFDQLGARGTAVTESTNA